MRETGEERARAVMLRARDARYKVRTSMNEPDARNKIMASADRLFRFVTKVDRWFTPVLKTVGFLIVGKELIGSPPVKQWHFVRRDLSALTLKVALYIRRGRV